MSGSVQKWMDMTNSQRSAALQLGYSQESWDNAELDMSPPKTAAKQRFQRTRRESPERAPVLPSPGAFSDLKSAAPRLGSEGSFDVRVPTVSKSSLMASMSGAGAGRAKSDRMATLAANKKKHRGPNFHMRMKIMEEDLHEQAKQRQKLQKRLQRKLDEKFGDGKAMGLSERLRMTPKKDFEQKDKAAHAADKELGMVEKTLADERAQLDEVMEELMGIRRQVEDTNGELTGTQRKMGQLLGLMEELLQGVLRKQDGNNFSKEARDELQRTVNDPIEKFFTGNNNIRSYIFEKLDNMSKILPRWPVDEELAGPTLIGDGEAQLRSEFKDWSAADFSSLKNHTDTGAGGVTSIVGKYRRHIVAEPPVAPHKHTRTAGVETEDGEFFMLGVYHGYDGVRSEEEIGACQGKLVKVVGTKNDSSPPNPDDEGDILAAITPYIAEIRSITVIDELRAR